MTESKIPDPAESAKSESNTLLHMAAGRPWRSDIPLEKAFHFAALGGSLSAGEGAHLVLRIMELEEELMKRTRQRDSAIEDLALAASRT